MIKREFIANFKSSLAWLLVLVFMFLFVFILYPFIITDETMKSMNEMMTSLSPEVLKAFNMDLSSIDTAYGWLKTEGFTFVLLIIGMYASILGGSIVLKEENDKTIEYLGFLPITRNKILTNKIIVGLTYVILVVVIFGIFNFITLLISGDFDKTEFILLSLTPIFIGLPLFSFNLFISMFLHKTKKLIGLSLGIVFLFYILSVMSELSSNIEFIKYFTVYSLADIRNVIENDKINLWLVLISILISALFIFLSYVRYNKKELV